MRQHYQPCNNVIVDLCEKCIKVSTAKQLRTWAYQTKVFLQNDKTLNQTHFLRQNRL